MLRQPDKRPNCVEEMWMCSECSAFVIFVCNETVVLHNAFYQTKPDKQALTQFTNCITSEKKSTHTKTKFRQFSLHNGKVSSSSSSSSSFSLHWAVCVCKCIGWALSSILHRQRAETRESKCAKENRAIGNKENANGRE